MTTEVYTLRLALERLPKQIPVEQITPIPRPSQLDEWHLYEQLERDRIRQVEGQVKLDDWTTARNVERIDRDQWRRSREFKVSMRDDPVTSMLPAGGGQPHRRKLSDVETDLLPPRELDEEEEG